MQTTQNLTTTTTPRQAHINQKPTKKRRKHS
ncbi:hypothetical protein Hsero_1574 [Herbaspirillum seropedicae SmR1]|uniref:Uncharacterized protein n=1 Tax=Herbaspirillum seropedicae (strain SmR1) TaxID=757424 RepID=D8IQ41_HERSS|nr:hypothetical protein Hsero_1574 [Herbaspirillum seropedicae SmR1]